MTTFYDHDVKLIDGSAFALTTLKDSVVLVVNTASACAFTPQYRALESLYQTYRNDNFSVLAFPCNQFGKQEPGSNASVGEFCQKNYGVSFPVFEKIDVNGNNAAPLFEWLKGQKPGLLGSKSIKWNFTKFLISKNGEVLNRFSPATKPSKIEQHIEAALKD